MWVRRTLVGFCPSCKTQLALPNMCLSSQGWPRAGLVRKAVLWHVPQPWILFWEESVAEVTVCWISDVCRRLSVWDSGLHWPPPMQCTCRVWVSDSMRVPSQCLTRRALPVKWSQRGDVFPSVCKIRNSSWGGSAGPEAYKNLRCHCQQAILRQQPHGTPESHEFSLLLAWSYWINRTLALPSYMPMLLWTLCSLLVFSGAECLGGARLQVSSDGPSWQDVSST